MSTSMNNNICPTTGNLFQSSAQALVNTVNCDGYMGKGLAYQFKRRFPQNNDFYVKSCKDGTISIGRVLPFKENDKIIINFPTKDQWQKKSQYKYIEEGLDSLLNYLVKHPEIQEIAIPPLGCGNGGLDWDKVYAIIKEKLQSIDNIKIYLYAPDINNYSKIKPNLSWRTFLYIEEQLPEINEVLIQKSCYFVNLFLGKDYFTNFIQHNYGPYSSNVHYAYQQLKQYLEHYNIQNNTQARKYIYNQIISDSVRSKSRELEKPLKSAMVFINLLKEEPLPANSITDKIELYTTIIDILKAAPDALSKNDIITKFYRYSDSKEKKFKDKTIIPKGIDILANLSVFSLELTGSYALNYNYFNKNLA